LIAGCLSPKARRGLGEFSFASAKKGGRGRGGKPARRKSTVPGTGVIKEPPIFKKFSQGAKVGEKKRL